MISEAEAFGLLERLLGFRAEPTRAGDAVRALEERLRVHGCDGVESYARLLDDSRVRTEETSALADRVTVNETYFLRESAQLDLVVEELVPRLLERGVEPVRILSAGCSTGDEPYGLALRLHEAGVERERVEILGVDVSPSVITRARRAQYSDWALRNVAPALRGRYFARDGKSHRLVDELRQRVRFEVANLVDDDAAFGQGAPFDIAICRNLLIYLTPEAITGTLARLARLLAPDGALLLGHAETQLAGPLFAVEEARGAYYFRRRGAVAAPTARARIQRPTATSELEAGTAWLEPIARSNARIHALAALVPPSAERVSAQNSEPPGTLDEIVELVRNERFSDALARIETTASDGRSERGLLRAAILTNLGRTTDAKQAVEGRLELLPRCAFAHYLLGVCRESLLELEEARQSYARSAELDPTFALAHLRGGLLARRAGQKEAARRALATALEHFPKQAARTLLLYGGGFARETLASLCRAELSALGLNEAGR